MLIGTAYNKEDLLTGKLLSYCDIIEIRLDYFKPLISDLMEIKKPILLTYRCFEEGGKDKNISLEDRIDELHNYLHCASYIDIEKRFLTNSSIQSLIKHAHYMGISVICSSHWFDYMPSADALISSANDSFSSGADIVKFVYKPLSMDSGLDIAKVLSNTNKFIIVMSTEIAERNLYYPYSWALYGSITANNLHQPTLKDLQKSIIKSNNL